VTLLRLDGESQKLMTALQAGDESTAREAFSALVPPSKASTANTKGTAKNAKPAKSAKSAKPAVATPAPIPISIPKPPSPHLNLAMTQWLEHTQQNDAADQRLAEWLQYPAAPALAYVRRAENQSSRGNTTLRSARSRTAAAVSRRRTRFSPRW
jgi:hypothetical protein